MNKVGASWEEISVQREFTMSANAAVYGSEGKGNAGRLTEEMPHKAKRGPLAWNAPYISIS